MVLWFNSVLNDEEVILALDQLHSEFVLVPTDKASNNVTIVCKKFYISLIQKELTSSNFIVDTRSGDDIIKEHSVFLSRFGIAMPDSNKKLLSLYCTPKQHKNPVGFRMITSGNNCSLQQLSKYIGVCLKSILHSEKNKCLYDNKFRDCNNFFVINSNENVVNYFIKSNASKPVGRKTISTFDFSNLYTSIPHDQLKNNLSTFINKVFEFKEKSYIIPNLFKKKAYFAKEIKLNSKLVVFTKEDLIECDNYLIDNSYVLYNDRVGIPMGTNAGPQLADVYLHEFEYDYIHKLIENKDEVSLRKLKDIFRYQDDLLVVNDDKLFGNVMNDIYPKEMVINNTNISPCKCNYLDLTISIYKGQFLVK